MKKYVTREKRVCFPAGFYVLCSLVPTSDHIIKRILFSPLENNIHIFAPPCNILYIFLCDREDFLTFEVIIVICVVKLRCLVRCLISEILKEK